MKWAACVLVLAAYEPAAHAIAACYPSSGWANAGADIPQNGHVVYWAANDDLKGLKVKATLGGKPITAKVSSTMKAGPFSLAVVDVDAKTTGSLSIETERGDTTGYRVVAKLAAAPKSAKATISHVAKNIPHSTVKETYDALAVKVDVPSAMRAHVKLRRDAKGTWTELDVPLDDSHTFMLGQLGCYNNYSPDLLGAGVDIEVQLTLADGSTLGIENFSHVQMPK
ncbi:MAG: hypothetical protein QM831_14945 [Kofleriaceae bacterium]